MLQLFKEHRDKVQMVMSTIALFAIWYFGYENYLAKNITNTGLDWNLNRLLSHETALWFELMGYKSKIITYQIYPHLMYLNNEPVMSVDTPCNGLPMIYLFTSFIIIYPGTWARKIKFILFGIIFMHLLNVIRIIGLSYIAIYYSDYFYFNHKYAFQIIVYTVVISMWFFWVIYGSNPKIKWMEGIKDFVQFRYLSKINQIF